jgi:hypothetical protein
MASGDIDMRRAGLILVALIMGTGAMGTGAASAQQTVCMRNGQVDAAATSTFQQFTESADTNLMQAMAGTWYAEMQSPQTNQISYQYNSFSPDGQFQYQNRVCGGLTNGCNDYQGSGFFAAVSVGDGSISVMTIVTDQSRNQECGGSASRFVDAATMQDSTGTLWRRVR